MHLFWRHSGLKRVPQTANAIDPRINRAFTDLLKVNMLLLQWVEMSGPTSASDSADLPSADLQQPKPPQSQSRPATTNRSNKGGTPSSKNTRAVAQTTADAARNLLSCIKGSGTGPASSPEAIATPPNTRTPGKRWVKGQGSRVKDHYASIMPDGKTAQRPIVLLQFWKCPARGHGKPFLHVFSPHTNSCGGVHLL